MKLLALTRSVAQKLTITNAESFAAFFIFHCRQTRPNTYTKQESYGIQLIHEHKKHQKTHGKKITKETYIQNKLLHLFLIFLVSTIGTSTAKISLYQEVSDKLDF